MNDITLFVLLLTGALGYALLVHNFRKIIRSGDKRTLLRMFFVVLVSILMGVIVLYNAMSMK